MRSKPLSWLIRESRFTMGPKPTIRRTMMTKLVLWLISIWLFVVAPVLSISLALWECLHGYLLPAVLHGVIVLTWITCLGMAALLLFFGKVPRQLSGNL